MRNSILIQLAQVWQEKPQKVTFAVAINTFLHSFERIFEVDNLTPSLAKDMFSSFLMQYESENKQLEKQLESKKAPSEQIEPQNEKQNKQNEISFLCECGAKFPTVQARSGHKKKCKL